MLSMPIFTNAEGELVPHDTCHAVDLAKDESLEQYAPGECPHCDSPCDKLYKICNIQHIGFSVHQNQIRASNIKGPDDHQQLQQFMGQSIHAGRQAADDIARIQIESGSSLDAITDKVRRDIFYNAALEYATRMPSTLPGVVVELLQKMFPRDLKFKDPSGNWHDARILFGNKNKHSGNNRLASDAVNSSSNSSPPPGMIDNLNLVYSTPDEVSSSRQPLIHIVLAI